MVTQRKTWLGAVLCGLLAIAPAGWASANHVRIEMSGPPAAGAPVMPETLRAENIRAQVVRAHTIYANKIEADEVQGVIHQTKDVKIGDARGKIRAPEVAASTIIAEEIHANTVAADVIYARKVDHK